MSPPLDEGIENDLVASCKQKTQSTSDSNFFETEMTKKKLPDHKHTSATLQVHPQSSKKHPP
jgi:hypothetical protein